MALAAFAVLVVGGCSGDEGGDPTVAPTTVEAPGATSPTPGGASLSTVAVGSSLCADQVFTPNTEDMVANLVATGLPCAEAESLLRRIGPLVGVGGPARIEIAGYACVLINDDDSPDRLPSSDYVCTNGERSVSFRRT